MDSTEKQLSEIGKLIKNDSTPMSDRYRGLFTLRNIRGQTAIQLIADCFDSKSALFKHECAYCLGQLQDEQAIPILCHVLRDKSQEPMVRHEAGEALGAIGNTTVVSILEEHLTDPVSEVSETCQLALDRIRWLHQEHKDKPLSDNPYNSVDPAPPCSGDLSTNTLKQMLLNENLPLFQRYRAMFSLRNNANEESVLSLAEGLKCQSALFRHEIAYVLGQIQHVASIPQLTDNLKDKHENAMVRHECAEALGSIATSECTEILREYLQDEEAVVSESCQVALDVSNYNNSDQLQYANKLKA